MPKTICLEKTKAEDEMREKLRCVTIGIMKLKSDIWITLSVIDFAFVSSALALTLTALQTSIYCVQRVSFPIQEACYQTNLLPLLSWRNMNFLKIFHIYDIAMYARTEQNISGYFNLKNPRIKNTPSLSRAQF